jgi:hypothetical protein
MKYTVYSYEIIDGDIDFIERQENKGEKFDPVEAKELAKVLDEEQKGIRARGEDLRSIVHLVYDENYHRIN